LGEFFLTSDTVMPTFTNWISLKPITEQIPEQENEAFDTVVYTMGGMMVFPGTRSMANRQSMELGGSLGPLPIASI
jgi:UDP-N-acetylmuramyl pentapeptide phosphotransferase/UDP-N-acetylglucosamine-1-phosphate transferase